MSWLIIMKPIQSANQLSGEFTYTIPKISCLRIVIFDNNERRVQTYTRGSHKSNKRLRGLRTKVIQHSHMSGFQVRYIRDRGFLM